jgi:predicted ABC-type ATPase
VNGAGKSSIAGATFRALRSNYFNPDEGARRLMAANPGLSQKDANGIAWRQGVRLLKRAIEERLDFAFETTLGGHTITQLLGQAASQGIEIHIWYVGLTSPELHLERVRARVSRGGHDIPERDVRRRFEHSRLNLIALLPHLTALRVHDNSREADPAAGQVPLPRLVLQMERGHIVGPPDLSSTPDWAKPIVAAALKLRRP